MKTQNSPAIKGPVLEQKTADGKLEKGIGALIGRSRFEQIPEVLAFGFRDIEEF
jgi:hypothetical protein